MWRLPYMYNVSFSASNSPCEIQLQHNSQVAQAMYRQICKVVASDEGPKMCFGPLYDDVVSASLANSTFNYILSKSPGENEAKLERYKAAVSNDILTHARLSYGSSQGRIMNMTDDEFQWMMIRDGSTMLLQSLNCLGHSAGQETFGRVWTPQSEKECFESIFFPGNQICNSVLQKLLQQDFFKQIIQTHEWRKPSDLFRKALYMCLLRPNLNGIDQVSCLGATKNYFFDCKEEVLDGEPSDVLHALHMLALGKGDHLHSNDGFPVIFDEPISSTTTDLINKGIVFKGMKDFGVRGIKFESGLFGGKLYMPVILADEHTTLVFQMLKNYECTENFSSEDREVTSYLGLIKDFIQTESDTNMLAQTGVIGDNLIFRNNFAVTLRGMDCIVTCEHIKYVKLQVRDYLRVNYLKPCSKTTTLILAAFGAVGTIYAIIQNHNKSN